MRRAALLSCVVVGALVPAPRKPSKNHTALDDGRADAQAKAGRRRPQEQGEHGRRQGQARAALFDDPVNTREYVSRVLCTKVALSEGEPATA